MELKKKFEVLQLLGGGVKTEVVKFHNFFFFSNESFPKSLAQLIATFETFCLVMFVLTKLYMGEFILTPNPQPRNFEEP